MYAGYQSFSNKHSSIHSVDHIPRIFFVCIDELLKQKQRQGGSEER